MTTPLIAIDRRPHDVECERWTARASADGGCMCWRRFASHSEKLPERAVWWPWLHGTPRTPVERALTRLCRAEVAP